jgi:hypothetical protein
MSFNTPPARPAPRLWTTNHAWSCCSTLTTQMLERACSSAFTRKPPKSESISSPPVLANSTLGSRPTAATIWSVSTWGKKRNSVSYQFPPVPTDITIAYHAIKNQGFKKKLMSSKAQESRFLLSGACGCGSVVEHLPSMCKALGYIPKTTHTHIHTHTHTHKEIGF